MIDYLYDGTFEGFLCCIYAHYYEERASGIYRSDTYQSNMLHTFRQIEKEEEKAKTVYIAIKEKISEEALNRVYRVFLSGDDEKEAVLLAYLRFGFKNGWATNSYHQHPAVFAVQQISKKVAYEAHKLTGLLRFSVITTYGSLNRPEGDLEREVLYSEIEPDHDVLELIADHFSDRYKSCPFIIHDKRRQKGLFASGGQWYIASLPADLTVNLAGEEKQYRELWKNYFHTIAIKERTNPRCQRAFMPVRYWKNLTEMH